MRPTLDVRIRRTQTRIRDAFMALVIEKGFDAVTVQAIAQRAHINRTTFYRHYIDKYDLAARLTNILFVEVIEQIGEQANMADVAQWAILFEHVQRFATFYRAMIGKGGIPEFRERVQASVESQMTAHLTASDLDQTLLKMPLSLSIRYMAAAQVGFIQWWLENDMPFSPKEAAGYLINLHLHGGMWALGVG